MKDFNIVEVSRILNTMELELAKYSRLFAEDGNIDATEQKVLDDIQLKLAKVKASAQKNISENAFSEEKLTGLPKAWLDLINENIPDKDKARVVLEVVKKIYDSNIKDQEDEVKQNVAIQALRNSLKSKKEAFTQADFHAEFDKLFRSGLSTEPDVEVNNPLIELKLPKGGIFEKKLGENSSFKVNLVITPKIKNDALVTVKSKDILDNDTTLELFKTEFEFISNKLSTKLLTLGDQFENVAGYEWLIFDLKMEMGNFESNLMNGDFSFSVATIKGTLKGSPTDDFLARLSPNLQFLNELAKVDIRGELSYTLKVSAKDQKLLKKLYQLSEELADKIEELPDLIKDAQKKQSAARRARKNVEKVKSKGAKAIKAAKDKANKANKLYKEAQRKVIDYSKDIKKLQKKINAVSKKISKVMQPMAKAIKGYFGKRAASVVMKFIPGLNIVSTALDVYDIGVVVAPMVLEFATNFWEEVTKIPEPVEIDERVQDFFEFIEKEEQLGFMSQALADRYQTFFESFNDVSYQDFKTKLEKLQGDIVYKSVDEYLGALKEKKAYFAEQMGSEDIIKQKIKADYVPNSAIINEAAQIITVEKEISFPHSNNEAVEPFIHCKYLITEKINNTYKITSIKDINIKTKDGISWTLSKGEIAIYEIEIDDLGNKTETWQTISY